MYENLCCNYYKIKIGVLKYRVNSLILFVVDTKMGNSPSLNNKNSYSFTCVFVFIAIWIPHLLISSTKPMLQYPPQLKSACFIYIYIYKLINSNLNFNHKIIIF